jgi:phage protein D
MNLPIADYTLIYNNKNITTDVSDRVISVEYTDKVTKGSAALTIKFEDINQQFIGPWYPTKGDSLQLIIRLNNQQLPCGTFTIDELSSEGSVDIGDVFTMGALASVTNKQLRTKNSYAHANKTLAQIAGTVAQNMGLTITGTIQQILLTRVHQFRETDLEFLNRLGAAYGYIFSVRGTQLIFVNYQDIETKGAVLTLARKDLISWDLSDHTNKTFKSSRLRHHDPVNKILISDEEDEDDPDYEGEGVDDLEIHDRVENPQQAKAKNQYALYKKNSQGVGGDITLPGNLLVVCGNNIQLNTEFGNLAGTYHVLEAKHVLDRDGAYLTSANIKRVKK